MSAYGMWSCSAAAMGIAMLISSAAAADESKAKQVGQPDMGFTFQTSTILASSFAPLNQTILLGGKFYRVTIALGIEASLFPPNLHYTAEARVALLRTLDKRVELFASGSVGYSPPEKYDTSSGDLRVRVGPGLRYWAGPRIGVHVASGLMPQAGRLSVGPDAGGEFAVVSYYGEAGMMVVF